VFNAYFGYYKKKNFFAVWQFPKMLITVVRYYLLGMKPHTNSVN